MLNFFNKLYVKEEALGYSYTDKIKKYFDDKNIEILDNENYINLIKSNELDIIQSKKVLVLDVNKSRFFHKCPGTKNYLCCGYYILNSGYNCPFNCSYCFLNFYLNNHFQIYFVNIDDLFNEMEKISRNLPRDKIIRVGTGEFIDSLAIDNITNFSIEVVNRFSKLDNIIFEFKTKSDNVENLLKVQNPKKNIVVSWSVNPPYIIKTQEEGTASLERRINAAKKIQAKGYLLGVHFDPIFFYSGWEKDYKELIELLYEELDFSRIVWVSLGIFRYQALLKEKIFEKNPYNPIIHQQYIRGKDDKLRLFVPLRIKIYRKIYNWLKEKYPKLFIYFCMESKFVWKEVTGWMPSNMSELEKQFIQKYESIDFN